MKSIKQIATESGIAQRIAQPLPQGFDLRELRFPTEEEAALYTSDSGRETCYCISCEGYVDTQAHFANSAQRDAERCRMTCLIDAAPELLEALKSCLEHLEGDGFNCETEITQAKAAIAKAEGK